MSVSNAATIAPAILPLDPGDRLSSAEFERRYDAMPGLKKAELIEGVVYMPSPVRHRRHSNPQFRLIGWLYGYATATPGVEGGDNGTTRLDEGNTPQPDAMLMIAPERGGQCRLSDDDYVERGPEFVGEVAASSASFDLHSKLEVYRRNGVREYLVWRVLESQIDWFALRGEHYVRLEPGADGILRSEILPGLWLDARALVRGDAPRVDEVLREGLATPDHAAFVQRLARP